MKEQIKAIDTIYKGCKFRSRLEARWAVFFDEIGADWEYEPEGFVITDDEGNRICYLPDFRINNYTGRGHNDKNQIYIEVKGDKVSDEEVKKIQCFSELNPILVVGNMPKKNWEEDITDRWGKEITQNPNSRLFEFNFETIDRDYYGAYPVLNLQNKFDIIGGNLNCFRNIKYKETTKAYDKARQARFEFKEEK